MRLLVTVGTTEFDALIAAFQLTAVKEVLDEKGVDKVIFQRGKGSAEVAEAAELAAEHGFTDLKGRSGVLAYSHNLPRIIAEADLVVSHGGAGTVMEALQLKKPLLVVSNAALMDNHQVELCDALVEAEVAFGMDGSILSTKEAGQALATKLRLVIDSARTIAPRGFYSLRETIENFQEIVNGSVGRDLFSSQPPSLNGKFSSSP